MKPAKLEVGDIVQIDPAFKGDPIFAGCLVTVTESKPFGIQGYIQMTGTDGNPGGQAYIRLEWEQMEWTGGVAPWVRP